MKITTHDGKFHSDEVSAVALINMFMPEETKSFASVDRIPRDFDESFLDTFDVVLDIGLKHDGVKYFDHHQHRGGKSSCGLVWDAIVNGKLTGKKLEGNFPRVNALVRHVDRHDVGDKISTELEYSLLLSAYNSNNIYGPEQDRAFDNAVDFAMVVFNAAYKADLAYEETRLHIKSCATIMPKVLMLGKYTKHWNAFVNGQARPEIQYVIWEEPAKDIWYVQVVPMSPDTYDMHGKPLVPDDAMEFVHATGFLGTAKTKDILIDYLQRKVLKSTTR